MVYNFQDVALWGMIATSSPNSDERARVAQWSSIGASLGGIILMVFPIIKGDGETLGAFGFSEQQMFMVGGLIFALGGELISMLAYNMKERVQVEAPEESIKDSLFVIRHNKTLLLISLARFLTSLSPRLQQNAYFFQSVVPGLSWTKNISSGTAMTLFDVLQGLPGAISVFFATKFAKKLGGMKKILVVTKVLSVVMRTAAFFIGFDSLPKVTVVLVLLSIMNIPGGMLDIAHRSLTSDSIDEVELKTGQRTEGISFSIQNFISKLSDATKTFISGVLLTLLKHDSKIPESQQNPIFMKWQWPMFMLGPVVGDALYLLAISFLEEDNDRKKEVELLLKKKREEIREEVRASVVEAQT